MVPNVTVGASLREALEYDQSPKDGEPRAEWIAGTLVGTPREMATQASYFRSLRPDCKKPVWRCSISLPPSDGRRTLQKWESIVTDFLHEMGIPQNAAWCAIRHFDRAHDHAHLTVLRTLPDGSLWNQEHSARRAIKVCEKLELVHNLNTHSRSPIPKDRPSRAEIEISKRKGTPMSREKIQNSVNRILDNHPDGIDFAHLQKLLAAEGIGVQPYAPGGDLKGVSYHYDSFKWPGSKIGRDFSAGLTQRGVRYGAKGEKDIPALARPTRGLAAKPDRDDDETRLVATAPRPTPRPPATVKSPMDMKKFTSHVAALDIGPLSKAMLILGGASINLAIEALLLLINFVKAILTRLGIKLRYPTQDDRIGEPYFVEPRTVTWDPVAKDLAPAFLPSELPTQAGIDDAAEKILATAGAIKDGNPESLPEVGDDAARVALVQALSPDGTAAAGALAAAAPALDAILDEPNIPAGPVATLAATVAAVTPTEAIARLKSAVEAWVTNRRDLITARTQPASAEAAQRTALEASFVPSTAAYQAAQIEARDVFTRLIDSVEDQAVTKKLNADLKSALGLMQMIEQPVSMYQDLPAFISSGIKQLTGVKAALEAAEAQQGQQQRPDQVDQDDGLHDVQEG